MSITWEDLSRLALERLSSLVTDALGNVEKEDASVPAGTAVARVPAVKLEDASKFVQMMAYTEAELKVQVCRDGCVCKTEVYAKAVGTGPGSVLVTIGTAHDPWCPWIAKVQQKDEEKEEAA